MTGHELSCPKCKHVFYVPDEQVEGMIKAEMVKNIKDENCNRLNLFEIIKETRRLVEKLPTHRKVSVPAKILRLVPRKPTNRDLSDD